MTITYQVKNAVYVNLTNRCPCACTFCLRNNSDAVFGSPRLWLEREPTLDEVISSLEEWHWNDSTTATPSPTANCKLQTANSSPTANCKPQTANSSPTANCKLQTANSSPSANCKLQTANSFPELVFCGYGEPTERLDVLLAAASHMKAKHPGVRIRVNTNGLSDLINGRATARDFVGRVDCLSISLNTDDPAEYLAVCRPKFGEAAYPAMLKFAADAVQCGIEVVMTVVGEPITSIEKQSRCRVIAESVGARLRVRPFEK